MSVKIPVNFLIIWLSLLLHIRLFICLFEKHTLEDSAGIENLVSITELLGAQWLGAAHNHLQL